MAALILLGTVEQMFGVNSPLAQGHQRGDCIFFGSHSSASRRLSIDDWRREIRDLPRELGDDLLRHALTDLRQLDKESRIFGFDCLGDFPHRQGQRPQRFSRADSLDCDEELEKSFVIGPEEADESRLDIATGGIAFQIKDSMERDLLTDARLEQRKIHRRHEQFVQQRPHLDMDAVAIDPAELARKC